MKHVFYSILFLSITGLLFCFGCSASGRKSAIRNNDVNLIKRPTLEPVSHKTTVKMTKSEGGVYEIPTEINGLSMHFIFDTGAGLISISDKEINLLREKGKFSVENDVAGEGIFTDANGDISEGTIIILRSVKIGDRILTNVEASVLHSQKAPLLMGQSALEQFGKISIDYKKEEITFE